MSETVISYHPRLNPDSFKVDLRTAFNPDTGSYLILDIGPLTIFPDANQLTELHTVIGDYLHRLKLEQNEFDVAPNRMKRSAEGAK